MHIELKKTKSTDLKNTFISQHNLPVHWGTCPIVPQAPENQQHKIFGLLSEPGGDFPGLLSPGRFQTFNCIDARYLYYTVLARPYSSGRTSI
jgi:hypothetical protein